ncbi:MAG: hypothetical protein J6Z01_06550 [Bacteroidales bacterium]|nr:hypothetical protein [Bacteroidales bacterium]
MKNYNKTYIIGAAAAFGIMTVVLNFFPRTTFSERERRDLASFPEFSAEKLASGAFTDSVSKWYSDSEPFREGFMTISENFNRIKGIKTGSGENAVTFIAGDAGDRPQFMDTTDFYDDDEFIDTVTVAADTTTAPTVAMDSIPKENKPAPKPPKPETENKDGYRVPNSGVILVGEVPTVRALLAFGCTSYFTKVYCEAVNMYKAAFPDVNIWVMPIPTASEFYGPEEARSVNWRQKPCIDAVFKKLDPNVHPVYIYDTLQAHLSEPIYLRTDHHWSALGGFYAAKCFADQAGLPFKSLNDGYEARTIHNFVGSMYGYAKDISVKNSPEDFVYYYPTQTQFTTHVISYIIDNKYNITKVYPEKERSYFAKFRDGSSGAYSTFLGSDSQLTRVETSAGNGRRVLILKDSYGNTIPSCLFYSFEEVHVVDFRYFTKNMKQYVADHKITDILFANNVTFCCTVTAAKKYKHFLNQPEGSGVVKETEENNTEE